MKVRGGAVAVGSSIHHARFYRVKSGKKDSFYMVRVFVPDLTAARGNDLFSLELPSHSLSMRGAPFKLRKALEDGDAAFIGWVTVGDELLLEQGRSLLKDLKPDEEDLVVTRWRVGGFEGPGLINLRPVYLAKEGLENVEMQVDVPLLDSKGWRLAVNKMLSSGHVQVIRRDAHGRIRRHSDAHLPVSYDLT